jgi:hypothetical protein
MKGRRLTVVHLLLAFAFRLFFGLCSEFWLEDERQTYLLGLKFYATRAWPFFGPDVGVPSPHAIQQPGALQGLVVGLPLFLLRVPEAPFLLLNLLSFAGLCLFAWYTSRRLPEVPRWFIWSWLLVAAPWTINFSTHVVNLSYLLPAGTLFFIGVFETCTPLSKGLVAPRWSNFAMGAALLWVMQFHLSWVLLPPFVMLSLYFQWREGGGAGLLRACVWLASGAALTGAFLAPTFIRYGLGEGLGGTQGTVGFNLGNLLHVYNLPEGVLGRFLSFASFELPRFIGDRTARRVEFFRETPWLIPFGLFLLVVGIAQPVAMFFTWFRRAGMPPDWPNIKRFTLATVCLIYLSFLFASGKPPSAHTYYVMLPVAMMYGFYCWSPLLRKSFWRKFALVVIACAVIFNAGQAMHSLRRKSLYVNRAVPAEAIERRDYTLLGERRPGVRY